MMTILDFMKQNNVHKSVVEKGKAAAVISVSKDEQYDTVVNDQRTGEAVYMKKIDNLEFAFDPAKTRVFIISSDQWKKMTTKNLFVSHLKGDVSEGDENV